MISRFDLKYHFYADDTQIYDSTTCENLHLLTYRLQQCFNEIKSWMNLNRLMLNDGKTEVILVGRPTMLKNVDQTSITFGDSVTTFSNTVKNLGVFLDSNLSFLNQVNNILRKIYLDLMRMRKVRHLLSLEVKCTCFEQVRLL